VVATTVDTVVATTYDGTTHCPTTNQK